MQTAGTFYYPELRGAVTVAKYSAETALASNGPGLR